MNGDDPCRVVPAFPKPVANRPGLATIECRIGGYAELREHMLARIDAAPALAGWTHRLPDDPGIALVEAAAEVGDILSFYQDLYANETLLRSAKWRDSVADLVRLLGYRLAPGLGGAARFAFAAKGDAPVLLPAGLQLKAQLDGDDAPAVFETVAEAWAYPALSAFRLWRPRQWPDILYGSRGFAVDAAGGPAPALNAGDRLMVGVARADGASYDHLQVVVVETVTSVFGRTVLTIRGGITCLLAPGSAAGAEATSSSGAATGAAVATTGSASAAAAAGSAASGSAAVRSAAPARPMSRVVSTRIDSTVLVSSELPSGLLGPTLAAGIAVPTLASVPAIQAWKLGATHRHFGHNAPAVQVTVDSSGRATTAAVSTMRRLDTTTYASSSPALASTQWPLDGEVSGMAAGTAVLVEANVGSESGGGDARKRLFERVIAQVDRQSLAWGALSGASTVLSLDGELALVEDGATLGYADIRGISMHEVQGAGFTLVADAVPTTDASGVTLLFYGSAAEAAPLAARSLLLAGPGAALTPANAIGLVVAADEDGSDPPRLHEVVFDQEVAYASYGYDAQQVTFYGNLVDATQGKTESQTTLGDGDARAVFQTFALPKTPLTYLLDAAQSPPQQPQLSVWVDSVEWAQVASLFDRGSTEQVYIVREDAAGKSWVQFGDGKTGARLSTGRGNVVAVQRSGSGAIGPLKPDAKPSIAQKVAGLDAAFLLEPVTGGAEPETADGARDAAPATMQSLGRIVSLADHEAEALAIPGVLKARADWAAPDGVPLVRVTLLTASASDADAATAADALRAAVRERGAGRCPLWVAQGGFVAVSVGLTVGHDPLRREDDVRAAILAALGATGEEGNGIDSSQGLMSWQRRSFGESLHGSQLIAAVQNADGVAWVQLTALSAAQQPLPASALMPSLAARRPPRRLSAGAAMARTAPRLAIADLSRRSLPCAADAILSLAAAAVALALSADGGGSSA